MSKSVLIFTLATVTMTLASVAGAAHAQPAASPEELVQFLPAGFYRKLSGDKTKCPDGHFSWIENNKTLAIGGAQPVLFHSFNSTHTETVALKTKCSAQTTNMIKDTSKAKVPSRTIAQVIKNDCGAQKTTSIYTLVASKIKDKTVVELSLLVSSDPSKKEPAIRCSYEIGPVK